MTLYRLWSTLRKLPREAWLFVLGLSVALSLVVGIKHYGADQYARGKRDAAQGVVFDSVTLARAAERVAKANAHTDAVWLRVKGARKKVDSAIVALPPEVADVPEVKALVATVQTLTVQVDSLTAAHTAERAAWTERARVDSAAIYALRIIGTAQRDTIMTLQKRPRWRTVAVGTLTGALLGVVAGVVK
jgi:hypothetical protein